VVGVADGDIITVLDANKVRPKIRLAGIDTPEKSQPFGNRSKESLSDLVLPKTVTVDTDKRDKYQRNVGKVLVDGVDANLEQIRRGMAWHCKAYQCEHPPTAAGHTLMRKMRPRPLSGAYGLVQSQCRRGTLEIKNWGAKMTKANRMIGRPRGWRVLALFTLIFLTQSATAQSEYEKSRNLTTCLDGRYPSLCKKQWLTAGEIASVDAAVRRANLSTCLDGRYPSLCKKELLDTTESAQVQVAEKRENLKTCITGKYKSLCKKHLLTAPELHQVTVAESAENLRTCLTGLYPLLCNKALLTASQLSQTQGAESQATKSRKQYESTAGTRTRRRASSGCESGHWVDSVSDDGEIVKLEDGSIWEVEAGDSADSALWLSTTDIVACDDKLINTDDNETVSARRIR
jgi:Staphylococcal nuclease homologue